MSFDWGDYLALAKELAGESNEAKLRSAISRAYYSIFCKARNYLHGKIPLTGKSIDHKLVSEAFKAKDDDKLKRVGVNLERLRIDRNKADYEDDFPNIVAQTEMDLLIAQESYEVIETL
ncbi:hypothetical protein DRP05_14825 [Archaeoglobales archaeon]|nr:MAG: hypothetical protein DRP05_14825 [Archaeoglobales archaeon]